jgi:hypothetical protein
MRQSPPAKESLVFQNKFFLIFGIRSHDPYIAPVSSVATETIPLDHATRGRCYDHNFLRKNWRFFSKTNVMIKIFVRYSSVFWVKNANFFRKYFKIHNIGPRAIQSKLTIQRTHTHISLTKNKRKRFLCFINLLIRTLHNCLKPLKDTKYTKVTCSQEISYGCLCMYVHMYICQHWNNWEITEILGMWREKSVNFWVKKHFG